MPTYEYRCPNGHTYEQFYRKISDAGAEVPCPECGQIGVRQLSGGAGLVFKGSGFYLTDYGKNAHRKSAPAASSGKSEGKSESKSEGGGATSSSEKGGSGETKSESKGESKAESKSESKGDAKPPATSKGSASAE